PAKEEGIVRLRLGRHRPTKLKPRDAGGQLLAAGAVEVTPRYLRVGDGYCATLAVTGYPAEVGAAWPQPLLSWPGRLDLAMHIEPLPAPTAAARLRTQRA